MSSQLTNWFQNCSLKQKEVLELFSFEKTQEDLKYNQVIFVFLYLFLFTVSFSVMLRDKISLLRIIIENIRIPLYLFVIQNLVYKYLRKNEASF